MLIHVSLHPVALKGVVPTNYPATIEPYGLRRPKSTNALMANCCTRRERPRCRAAEQRDELAPPSLETPSKNSCRINAAVSLIPVRSAHGNYKENKKPWDDCQACRVGQKAEIGQGLTIFILQGRPQRPVRNHIDHLVGEREQRRRQVEPERLGGLEIDHQQPTT